MHKESGVIYEMLILSVSDEQFFFGEQEAFSATNFTLHSHGYDDEIKECPRHEITERFEFIGVL